MVIQTVFLSLIIRATNAKPEPKKASRSNVKIMHVMLHESRHFSQSWLRNADKVYLNIDCDKAMAQPFVAQFLDRKVVHKKYSTLNSMVKGGSSKPSCISFR